MKRNEKIEKLERLGIFNQWKYNTERDQCPEHGGAGHEQYSCTEGNLQRRGQGAGKHCNQGGRRPGKDVYKRQKENRNMEDMVKDPNCAYCMQGELVPKRTSARCSSFPARRSLRPPRFMTPAMNLTRNTLNLACS